MSLRFGASAARVLGASMLLLTLAGSGLAQLAERGDLGYRYEEPRFEVYGMGGYAWTISRGIYNGYTGTSGDVDIKSGLTWSGGLNLAAPQGAQIELAYGYQASEVTYKDFRGKSTLSDVTVQYLQIGALKGIRRGNMLPFTSITLGSTRFGFTNSRFDDFTDNSAWKFSAVIGAGVKVYTEGPLGFRFNLRLPITFTSGGVGIGCGGGGCGASVGGTGITQFELAAGVFIAR